MRFGLVICGLLLALACQESQSEDAIFHPAGQRALKPAGAQAEALTASGEVYVPIYSNVYWGRSGGVMEISATLSVRNVDAQRPLVLTHVDYYDSRGKLIRKYLDAPVLLDPMGTVEWMIDVHDTEGGSGANFIVGWGSQGPIARPVMEAIMLAGSRGISFVSQGRPVEVVGESNPQSGPTAP